MKKVFEVNTVEIVERRYLVEVTHYEVDADVTDQHAYWRQAAIEKVKTGEVHKFTESNAEIREISSAREQ